MSVSDKESVASDTDIKDIEIPHDEYSDDDNMMQFEQTSEPSSNNSLSQNITNKKTSDNQSRLLLDTLQQNVNCYKFKFSILNQHNIFK